MSPDSKSENEPKLKGTITDGAKANAPKSEGLAKLILNAFLVILAVLALQVFFHSVNYTMNAYLSYFTGTNILILVGYAVLFAFMYDKFSAIWSSNYKRARISLFNYNPAVTRPLYERIIDTLLFALFTAAVIWCGIQVIDAAGLTDTDADGVNDSSDFWFVVMIIVSAVGQESGGKTESDGGGRTEGTDDSKDKGSTGTTGTGTGG